MKLYFILLCCLIYVTDVTAAKPQSHTVTFGATGSREVHLKRDMISDKAKLMRIISQDYEFKQTPGKIPFGRIITRIVVTDLYTNGNGGTATLTSGGPGEMYAVLHLRSQRGHGYNFIIDIFGQ